MALIPHCYSASARGATGIKFGSSCCGIGKSTGRANSAIKMGSSRIDCLIWETIFLKRNRSARNPKRKKQFVMHSVVMTIPSFEKKNAVISCSIVFLSSFSSGKTGSDGKFRYSSVLIDFSSSPQEMRVLRIASNLLTILLVSRSTEKIIIK